MNWVIILARGVVGVDILPLDRELGGEGMAIVVWCLQERLREMLGADARLPRVLMSDRGTGMYAPSGHVVRAYDLAPGAGSGQCTKYGFEMWRPHDSKRSQNIELPTIWQE